eukprot:6614292-Ditylum_brightwellii.AAC.1
MFGMPDWKEESKLHGPQLSKSCVEQEVIVRDQPSPMNVKLQALELSLDVLQGTGLVAVVICGTKEEECTFLDIVQADSKFAKVIPLYEATLEDEEEGTSTSRMTKITRSIENAKASLQPLKEAGMLVGAIFYDLSSTSVSNEVLTWMNNDADPSNPSYMQNDFIYFAAMTDSQD